MDTGSGSAIWRGPVAVFEEPRPARQVYGRVLLWALFFVGLVVARLQLPFTTTDTMRTHMSIVDSLLHGHNWGRQALVGSVEFPTLPTLGLLLAELLGRLVRVPGGRLLVAVAQAWGLCYFIRVPEKAWRSWLACVWVGLLPWLPEVRQVFLASDPNWIVVVPVCGLLYHLARWNQTQSLRDVIVCAMHCGVLAFAGWVGMACAFAVLLMMCLDLPRLAIVEPSEQGGIRLLIWAPFCYCVFLWLLWNWLVMGDMLFACKRLVEAGKAVSARQFFTVFRDSVVELSFLVGGGFIVLLFCLRGKAHGPAMSLLAGLLAAVLSRAALHSMALFASAGTLVTLIVGAMGLVLPILVVDWRTNRWRFVIAVAAIAGSAWGSWQRPGRPYTAEHMYMVPAPSPSSVTACVDRFWPGSRIFVFGVCAPAIYHDAREARFVACLDFHRGMFLAQAEEEQLHILVPPRNGVFYAKRTSPLSMIHQSGAPWLLLERQWPSGWQLWRCVVAPRRESKLRTFE